MTDMDIRKKWKWKQRWQLLWPMLVFVALPVIIIIGLTLIFMK